MVCGLSSDCFCDKDWEKNSAIFRPFGVTSIAIVSFPDTRVRSAHTRALSFVGACDLTGYVTKGDKQTRSCVCRAS